MIYGPVMDKGVWRIGYNFELYRFMGGKDIVRFVKAQRIQWVGHVERMDETAMPKRVLKRKLYAKRRIGRPRLRWTDDVTDELRKMGIEKARSRNQWRLIVKETKAHSRL
jgi:hypothetical protein